MENFLDWALDALIDTLKMAPFLLLALILIEYIEHRSGERLVKTLGRAGRLGPGMGAVLGCVPQCGFSVAAARLYNGGLITAGTLLAVFLSTSDEAIPILLASPGGAGEVGKLILAKVIIALIAGFGLDALWKKGRVDAEVGPEDAHHHDCDSDSSWRGILLTAGKRALSILAFLFLATLLLNIALGLIGPERLGALMLQNSPLQPFMAALFGFIPNCAASVLLTEFYLSGAISFGSAVAGLCTGAGLGLLALLRGKSRRGRVVPLAALYIAAVVSGLMLQYLF